MFGVKGSLNQAGNRKYFIMERFRDWQIIYVDKDRKTGEFETQYSAHQPNGSHKTLDEAQAALQIILNKGAS